MKKGIAACTVVLTLVVALVAQAGLAGKWQGETDGGAAIVLTLAVRGTALSGTFVRDGESAPLSDGKVLKDTFTFTAQVNGRSEAFSGELIENRIKIWLDRQGASKPVFLSRITGK